MKIDFKATKIKKRVYDFYSNNKNIIKVGALALCTYFISPFSLFIYGFKGFLFLFKNLMSWNNDSQNKVVVEVKVINPTNNEIKKEETVPVLENKITKTTDTVITETPKKVEKWVNEFVNENNKEVKKVIAVKTPMITDPKLIAMAIARGNRLITKNNFDPKFMAKEFAKMQANGAPKARL